MEESLGKEWSDIATLELDYELMRQQVIEWVQCLAGDRWTNFNESDPGVTIIEQLCYALTELCFQAEMPVSKLLASTQTLRIELNKQGLYAPQDILPGPALSLLDQRRWLLDQLPDVANIWLTPIEIPSAGVPGTYQIDVLPFDKQVAACSCHAPDPGEQQRLEQTVRANFSALRNLGEDVAMVNVLTPVPVEITASLQINDKVQPDEIVADLMFQLGLLLAPEPRRHSLEDRLKQGLTTSEIFQGPPLQSGFIAEDQLDPLPTELKWIDVEELIASLSGVLKVENLSVKLDSKQSLEETNSYQNKSGTYLRLAVDIMAESPPFTLLLDGNPVACNSARIQRLLERRWYDHRRKYNNELSSELAFSVPVASPGELGDYSSVLNLFPAVYGMRADAIDLEASPKRQGQIKQLKGYLMIFDQLMADFMAQLAFLPKLFSPAAGDQFTYDHRSLRNVSGCDGNLLVFDYDKRHQLLAKRLDQKERRQSIILDFFLSIYGQQLLPGSKSQSISTQSSADIDLILEAKRKLLDDLLGFSRQRGTGVDYCKTDNIAAPTLLEKRCLLELQVRREAKEQGPKPSLVAPEQATFGRLLPTDRAVLVQRSYLPLDGLVARLSEPEGPDQKIDPLRGQLVAAELWPALADPSRYRVGQGETGRGVDLVCIDQVGCCWWLGGFDHARQAHAYAHLLVELAGGHAEALHLIEWVLLRHALELPKADNLNPELFKFRVSAVLPLRKDRENISLQAREAQKKSLTNLLRPHIPAHLELQVHLLSRIRWRRFLDLRSVWLKSLEGDDPVAKCVTSRRMVLMLQDEAKQMEKNDTSFASQMIAMPAAANALGAKCEEPPSKELLRSWRAANVAFLMLPLSAQSKSKISFSQNDLRMALGYGFALMPYYEPPFSPELPSVDLGRSHGIAAVRAATTLRLCKQVVIWLASYPPRLQSGEDKMMDYFKSWAAQIQSGGFGAGLFVTPTTPCTDLRFRWFCQAASASPPMTLGFSMTLVDQDFPADLLQRGKAIGCRVLMNRSGHTPPWLTLDPRALPAFP